MSNLDALSKRLDRIEAQIQPPIQQGPHEFNMQLFTPEEQAKLTDFLVEIIDVGSLNKLSNEQLDVLEKWFLLEQSREFAQA